MGYTTETGDKKYYSTEMGRMQDAAETEILRYDAQNTIHH